MMKKYIVVQQLLENYKIPSRVLYIELDNKLLLDFTLRSCIDLFIDLLKKSSEVILEECLFTPENSIVEDQRGMSYNNEIVIPIVKEIPERVYNKAIFKEIDNGFLPGSEWLYLKLYCSERIMDKVLEEIIHPFVQTGIEEKIFEKFFFIRFEDDSPHIRIRFYNQEKAKNINLLFQFLDTLKPYTDSGLIFKITSDTYIQEKERYEPFQISFSETLFFLDSLAILRALNLGLCDSEISRILIAMKYIDCFLKSYTMSLDERIIVSEFGYDAYFKEFGSDIALQQHLNKEFRLNHKQIYETLKSEKAIDLLKDIFTYRQEMINNELAIYGRFSFDDCKEFITSHIHMTVNRLFSNRQRRYELIVYHFMTKYYKSEKARLALKA